MDICPEQKIFKHTEILEYSPSFRHVGNPQFHDFIGTKPVDTLTVEFNHAAERFSVDHIVPMYESCYEEMLRQ